MSLAKKLVWENLRRVPQSVVKRKLKSSLMKKIFVTYLLTAIVTTLSCKKSNDRGEGDYCYTCHVTGGHPYQDRYLDTCVREEGRLGFVDANGNDLNHFCTPK